jgi:hypothetical protein
MPIKHIQTATLASDAAVINFSGIPQGGTDLIIKFAIRATVNQYQDLRFALNNNAGGVVYTGQDVFGQKLGTTVADMQALNYASNRFFLGRIPGPTATGAVFSMGEIIIYDYARTDTKIILYEMGFSEFTTGDDRFSARLGTGFHGGSIAVNRLDFFVPSQNLAAGSTVSIYERK